MANFELLNFSSDEALAGNAASRWVKTVEDAGRKQQKLLVALSGGRIAAKFFAAVVTAARTQELVCRNVQFFWADERCVPPDHPESNYALAYRHLLEPLQVSLSQIHRLKGEQDDHSAVSQAVAELRGIAPATPSGMPVLDLVLLGMGEDGHVASLFPVEAKGVMESADIYRAVVAVKPPPRRLTLGYGVLAAARSVWVLASGSGKAMALQESLRPDGKTPLARVLHSRSNTLLFSDIAGI